jgi:antitoxin component YwqK of YwqJK toxin-antitoxin module
MDEVHESIVMSDTTSAKTSFFPYFDYIGVSDPKYSSDPNATYINAYVVECLNNKKDIVSITDINENVIDITDSTNFDLKERINNVFCLYYYSTYDIARHNMIYIIYFGEPKMFNDSKYDTHIYKTIRDNLSYTGNSYYYHKDGTILRTCFHINGSIEGKFHGYYYNGKPISTDVGENWGHPNGENWEHPNGYKWSTTYILMYEIDYVNGKIHGKYIKKHRCGRNHFECDFENGNIIGLFREYRENGGLATECNYVDGKIEGNFITYGEQGYVIDRHNNHTYNDTIYVGITNYVNGLENGKSCNYTYSFSKNTYELNWDCNYVNGKINGNKNIYDKNGKIIRTIAFIDNTKNGLSTYMGKTKYGNGYYIQIEKTYKDGYRNGINKYYNELGQITMTKLYKDGRVYNISYYYSTGVKKKSIDITYDDTPIYTEYNMCTKEFHTTKKYNESEEIISIKKKTEIIEHDGYEMCNDSDYYDSDNGCRNFNDKDKKYICFSEYAHFVNS